MRPQRTRVAGSPPTCWCTVPTAAGAFWMPIARELTLRGHRVVMVDQPRHGVEAFVPESYQRQDLKAMAAEPSPLKGLGLEDYEARVTGIVRRAARNGPVVLVGHSLGGVSVSRVGDAVPHLLHHICYMAAFCPSRVLPTADACTAAPENANAVSPVELTVGDPDRLGVLRLNFRTGDSHGLALLKEMICADYPDAEFRRILASTCRPTSPSPLMRAERSAGLAAGDAFPAPTCVSAGTGPSPPHSRTE